MALMQVLLKDFISQHTRLKVLGSIDFQSETNKLEVKLFKDGLELRWICEELSHLLQQYLAHKMVAIWWYI